MLPAALKDAPDDGTPTLPSRVVGGCTPIADWALPDQSAGNCTKVLAGMSRLLIIATASTLTSRRARREP